jgi:hypothetical protein
MDFLAQGTLYTDIIESGTDTAQTIKSHHNVGGLPEDMQFKLIEPINTLFKDEGRELGKELGLSDEMPFAFARSAIDCPFSRAAYASACVRFIFFKSNVLSCFFLPSKWCPCFVCFVVVLQSSFVAA